jgi:hypothetical protein
MEKEAVKRPVLITVICVIGFLGAAVTVPVLFSDPAKNIGAWYPPFLALSALIGLACMIGMWLMKKWGVLGYAGFVLINQVVMLVMNLWTLPALIIPLVIVALAFTQFQKME